MIIPLSITLGYITAIFLPPQTDPPLYKSSPLLLGTVLLFGGVIIRLLSPATYLHAFHSALLIGLLLRFIYEDARFLSIGAALIPVFYAVAGFDYLFNPMLNLDMRLVGVLFWGLVFGVLYLWKPNGLGTGDVLLAPAVGFLLGPYLTAISLFMGATLGIVSWFFIVQDKKSPLPLLFYWFPFVVAVYLWMHQSPLMNENFLYG